jgi:hypothetical protein
MRGTNFLESDRYSDCLVRLPMYYELGHAQMEQITQAVTTFFRTQAAKLALVHSMPCYNKTKDHPHQVIFWYLQSILTIKEHCFSACTS